MENKNINICFASDNWYAEHLLVAIYSLIYNLNKDYNAVVYILDWWISKENTIKIKNIESKFNNIKIEFIKIIDEKYSKIDSKHLTKEAYFRIDLPYIFPNLDMILYLDCDIIVDDDISSIDSFQLWDKVIWAPNDIWTYHYYNKILCIPWDNEFFNTWVLLMNLDSMRKNEISKKIFEYIDKNIEKIIACDQDAINAVCWDKKLVIPLKYNALDWVFMWFRNKLFTKEEYNGARKNPVVIHYAWSKPWKKYCTHPLRNKYHEFRKLAWLDDVVYQEWLQIKLLKKNLVWLLWIYLLNTIPRNLYYYIVFKPKQLLSNIIK